MRGTGRQARAAAHLVSRKHGYRRVVRAEERHRPDGQPLVVPGRRPAASQGQACLPGQQHESRAPSDCPSYPRHQL